MIISQSNFDARYAEGFLIQDYSVASGILRQGRARNRDGTIVFLGTDRVVVELTNDAVYFHDKGHKPR